MKDKFFKYIRAGDLDNVIKCVEEYKIDPSEKNNESICCASAYGNLNVVKYLISLDQKYNIDPSAENNYAIRLASVYGNLNVVKYLISLDKKYNIDPAAENNYAIRLASINGHIELVKYLMSLDKKYKIDPSANNDEPIHGASFTGHIEIVKILSTHYLNKLRITENNDYNQDINNYIREFNKNPLEMNKKMKSYYFNNDLKYYSLTILFNDDYLIFKKKYNKDIKKFFNIAKGLNNDVLMLLINILVSNNKIIISSNDFNSFLKETENMEWLFIDNEK